MNCPALIERFVTDRDETSVNQLGERTHAPSPVPLVNADACPFALVFKTKELTLLDFIVHIG